MLEEQFDLPEGWSWVTVVNTISDAQPGFASGQKDVKGGINHLRMNNIGSDCQLNLQSVLTVPRDLAQPRHILEFNDVLVCHTNSVKLVGKTALFNIEDGVYAFSNHLTRLRISKDSAIPKWLWFVLSTLWRERYFENRCKQWVNQAAIERDVLLAAPVPLPPLPEQQRIVEKIEKLFAESRTAREALDAVPSLLKRFRQSVLAKAFRGELAEHDPNDEPASVLLERIKSEREKKKVAGKKYVEPAPIDTSELPQLPEGWEWVKLGELTDLFSGHVFKKSEYLLKGVRLLQIANVSFNRIIWEQTAFLPKEYISDYPELVLNAGDIVMALNRPLLGEQLKIGQLQVVDAPAILYQRVGRFDFYLDDLKTYFPLFAQSRFFIDRLKNILQGTDQPFVNKSDLLSIPIPLAPLAEQRRIVAKIESLFAQAEAIEQAVEVARRRAQQIDQAILARAFRGGM